MMIISFGGGLYLCRVWAFSECLRAMFIKA
jgi:hypothetical protein